MFQDLRKKANEPEAAPGEATKGAAEAEGVAPKAEAGSETPPAAPEKGKEKVNPWKLIDEHKAARAKAEQELADLRKSGVDPLKGKEYEEKISAIQKRNEELENHMRFVDYSKSTEFAEKYQKPYDQAWQRWMGDLGELTVRGEDGSERAIAPTDILELVNLPLPKARESAEEKFGAFADDVMSARKEIRSLFESQQRALEEAKTKGKEHIEGQTKAQMAAQEALTKEISEVWTQANQSVVTDEKISKWFKPVEGDEEGNTRLSKGYELADRAFTMDPRDPRLSKEQRAEVVRLHAAIRNRAAAFGRIAFQNDTLSKRVAELEGEIAKYKQTEPGNGQSRSEAPASAGSAKDRMRAALAKVAH